MTEKSPPLYVCNAPAVSCDQLILPADSLDRANTALHCVDKRTMDRESVIYLEEAIAHIENVMAQLNRWTRHDG